MNEASIVLAHSGAGADGGVTAFTIGVVAVLVVVWAGLAALAWVFYAAKRRDDARAAEEGAATIAGDGPRPVPGPGVAAGREAEGTDASGLPSSAAARG